MIALVVVGSNCIVLLLCMFITYCFHIHDQKLGKQIQLVRQQIQHLYGPLGLLLVESQQMALAITQISTTTGKTIDHKDGHVRAYKVQFDVQFFSHLQRIVDLVTQKTHLFLGEKPPKSFDLFLDYQQGWLKQQSDQDASLLCLQRWQALPPWPQPFTEDILSTYHGLCRQYTLLLAGALPKVKNPRRAAKTPPDTECDTSQAG